MKHTNEAFFNKSGFTVVVKDNDLEAALKILKRKIVQENLIIDIHRQEYYVKPSERKRQMKHHMACRERIRSSDERKRFNNEFLTYEEYVD